MCLDTYWRAGGGRQALAVHASMFVLTSRADTLHALHGCACFLHNLYVLLLMWPPCAQAVYLAHAITHTNH